MKLDIRGLQEATMSYNDTFKKNMFIFVFSSDGGPQKERRYAQ